MNDPQHQAQAGARSAGLWGQAPGWRNLVIGATLLTATAVALPAALTRDETPAPPALHPVTAVHVAAAAPSQPAAAPAASMPAPPPAAGPPTIAPPTIAPTVRTASLPAPPPLLPHHAMPAPAPAAPELVQPATPAPQTNPSVCLMVAPPAPTGFGSGLVMAFEDTATSLARIQLTEAQMQGKIDPDYVGNMRVQIRLPDGNYRVVLVPKTMVVHPGDRVMFQGGYRNNNLPCNYIPNLITADLGPPPQPAAGAAPQPP